MSYLTLTTIRAAQRGEREATDAVLRSVRDVVRPLASRVDARLADDLSAVALAAVWEGLGRFYGSTAREFWGWARATAKGAMADARRELTYEGVGPDTMARFEAALRHADHDPARAEQLASSPDAPAARMTPDNARAARLAWQRTVSLDAPVSEGGTATLGGLLGAPAAHPPAESENPDLASATEFALRLLSRRRRYMLRVDFGFCPPRTDHEIADRWGVSVKTVRSIRSKARADFRKCWRALYGS